MMAQCILRKKTEKGTSAQLAWIPEEFAVSGKVVKIKERDIWDDGWVVADVFQKMEDKEQSKLERVWKKHREVTDI